jgi:hypothetical protein
MASQPNPLPHQLEVGSLYCANPDCGYCKELRAARVLHTPQLRQMTQSISMIRKKWDWTLADLILYTCGSVMVLGLLVVLSYTVYLWWR